MVIDRNGLIQSFNRAAEKIFGHHAEDVIGRNVNILIPVEQRAAHDEGVAVYRGAGVSKEMGIDQNLQGLRADGRLFDIEMSLKALDIEGITAL